MGKTPEQWAKTCENIRAGFVGSTGKAKTYANGREFVGGAVKALGLWKPGDRVLEIGSGNGRVAMGLLGEGVEYHGVEVVAECVEFCNEAFRGEGAFRFYHLDVQNERYNADGKIAPDKVILPFADGAFDLVIAMSLFSHLGTVDAMARYITEAMRALRIGGKFLSTWYLSPPEAKASDSAARTVYRRTDALRELGRWFVILQEGGGRPWGEQRYIVAERPL